ncbi:hypothetical protein CEP10_14395 [Cylindrospermopsis raciborskii S07]|uniref:Uncharacterized protein n=1 Tax=Cylindrospermopsis raciborskii C07 TaxID=2014886 RepID=A0ABX4WIC1_9CYAN|nr:hypothetical protein [Cylindrospermopsis raciborskii]PNJ90699.1 hypothetical protein CEP14_18415 [Cylindrospermopsis raciborskii C04]PNJ91666.1 hypothetical protein CEP15_17740 [Cylindrospermopsis raciborskii C07]PNK04032.1 hypothetical protein CEP10_14395 [Cylindrospermopsis raciborskii S07]PNK04215.1 hypothetical protein CEP12_13345 [Cylindrospermopsis raciborskii S14]PNK04609.1 hypothetical protein CEP11_11570 [Cylindrospermopsis raciborskii S10]PNK13403.1 hypothetical protein CEP07_163
MRNETQQTNRIYINAIDSLWEIANYPLLFKLTPTWRLSVGETGLKAKVSLKPTSFVMGNRRLG